MCGACVSVRRCASASLGSGTAMNFFSSSCSAATSRKPVMAVTSERSLDSRSGELRSRSDAIEPGDPSNASKVEPIRSRKRAVLNRAFTSTSARASAAEKRLYRVGAGAGREGVNLQIDESNRLQRVSPIGWRIMFAIALDIRPRFWSCSAASADFCRATLSPTLQPERAFLRGCCWKMAIRFSRWSPTPKCARWGPISWLATIPAGVGCGQGRGDDACFCLHGLCHRGTGCALVRPAEGTGGICSHSETGGWCVLIWNERRTDTTAFLRTTSRCCSTMARITKRCATSGPRPSFTTFLRPHPAVSESSTCGSVLITKEPRQAAFLILCAAGRASELCADDEGVGEDFSRARPGRHSRV